MKQGTKEFNEQQIAKIQKDKIQKEVQKAKSEGEKVVRYLADNDEYYFKSLTTIRRANLISAILWITISIVLFFGLMSLATYTIIPALQMNQSDTGGMSGAIAFAEIVFMVLFVAAPIIMLVLSVKAFKFRMNPSGLKKYFVWNLVITSIWAIILLFAGGIPGILAIVSAIFLGLALSDIRNYRDWFMGFGGKKSVSRSGGKSRIGQDKNGMTASKKKPVVKNKDDEDDGGEEYYDGL